MPKWLLGFGGALVVVLAGVAAGIYWRSGPPNTSASSPTASTARVAPQTETAFVNQYAKSSLPPDLLAEWRAARGDHKMIAYAIANCEQIQKDIGNIDAMPNSVFSALMLDLTPIGDHTFYAPDGTSDVPISVSVRNGPSAITLSSYQQAVLYLSDAIARARLAAATGASSNYPQMRLLGWITVGLSAVATLLVTIKSSMTAPPTDNEKDSSASGWITWVSWLRKWGILPSRNGFRRFMFVSVGILAMILSAAVTALTSVKQFYDPISGYKGSEVALIGLRQLHNQVALGFLHASAARCGGGASDTDWKIVTDPGKSLPNYEAAVIAASATLQDTDLSRLGLDMKKPTDLTKNAQDLGPKNSQTMAGPTVETSVPTSAVVDARAKDATEKVIGGNAPPAQR